VTSLRRSPSFGAGLRAAASRRLALALGSTATLLAATLLAATPAAAVVTEVGGTKLGLQPRNAGTPGSPGGEPTNFSNATGNAVLHGTNVFPIYWDPLGETFHHEWLIKIDTFFQQMGAGSGDLENIFASIGQYRDRTNQPALYQTVYKGSYHDTVKYPTAGCTDPNPAAGGITCLTDTQLREQLKAFIAAHGLPKGMNAVYYVLTPPGVTVCADVSATSCSDYKVSKSEEENRERNSASYQNSFCSYHGDINPDNVAEGDANTILYAAIPWTAGTLGIVAPVPGKYPSLYAEGFDCQDGGWSPVNKNGENAEIPEVPKELNKEEETAYEKADPEEKAAIFKRRRLEGPHQEEPNQEAKGEIGDYGPGLADLIINQIAEEQANIVTDPLLNGWRDPNGNEVTDECRNIFGNTVSQEAKAGIQGSLIADEETEAGTLSNTKVGAGRYYINNAFSLSGEHCVGGVAMVPRFTAPNPVNANEIVGFDGMESTVGLDKGLSFGPSGPPTTTYATFTWNFGDGTEVKGFAPGAPICEAPWLSPCAASIYHTYQYGGIYQVTLTVTDVAGNKSSVSHEVTVDGPSRPEEKGSSGGSGPGGSSGSSGSGSASSSASGSSTSAASVTPGVAAKPPVPSPVAAAATVSKSLSQVLRGGLVVRYSVNEQVAGRFEVLLASSIAKRIGLHGSPATGLPQGSAPQIVIAKAILVTTKGGRNTIKILFGKTTAARLRKLRKVSLMLRLVVRNASSQNPIGTTVISTVNLGR
jgi:hypothetical protein